MNILFFLKPKSEVAYVTGNSTIRQGIEKLKAHRYTAIPVLDEDGSYVGTVNEGDFLRYIVENNQFNLKDRGNESPNKIEVNLYLLVWSGYCLCGHAHAQGFSR